MEYFICTIMMEFCDLYYGCLFSGCSVAAGERGKHKSDGSALICNDHS